MLTAAKSWPPDEAANRQQTLLAKAEDPLLAKLAKPIAGKAPSAIGGKSAAEFLSNDGNADQRNGVSDRVMLETGIAELVRSEEDS